MNAENIIGHIFMDAGHIYASAARDMVSTLHFVKAKLLPALRGLEVNSAVIEEVTGMVSPEAENVERTAFAVLGMIVAVIDKLPDTNGSANITVDAALVEQIKAVSAAIKKNMVHQPTPTEAKQ